MDARPEAEGVHQWPLFRLLRYVCHHAMLLLLSWTLSFPLLALALTNCKHNGSLS